MLPEFLGMLLFLGTAAAIALMALLALWGVVRKNRVLLSWALRGGGIAAGVYGFFWLLGLGLAMARPALLAPPAELEFCGLDCHLHVSVAGISAEPELGVTVRFRSNAVRAPEFPRELRFRLRDAAGREYAPLNDVPESPLLAGESRSHLVRFPAGDRAGSAELIVTWNGWLDYFVPGAGNPLVQRQRRLALPERPTTGV
jgi:hypothetical protein